MKQSPDPLPKATEETLWTSSSLYQKDEYVPPRRTPVRAGYTRALKPKTDTMSPSTF